VELTEAMLREIKKAAQRVNGYGSITIRFMDNVLADIETTDKMRLQLPSVPRAGEVVKEKRVVVVRQERQG